MAAFEYRQAQQLRDAFAAQGVRFLFLGKSGAILFGFPDTTQDLDVYPKKSPENGSALLAALVSMGFDLSPREKDEIAAGKDFVQLKNGPFDLDLIFAPDGIESFDKAWDRRVELDGFPVCHLDDIIESKRASNRPKDRESLPRLIAFRDYWLARRRDG